MFLEAYSRFMEPRGTRILVVDDDAEIQRVLKRAGEAAGYEVVQALDGAAGLALATAEQFDLIVLDIAMPTSDGRDLLNRLKQNRNTADIPVLVYSGRDHADDRRVVYELGAENYVDKPFAAGLLIKKIGRIIEKARKRGTQT
jgi:DNA-binding response OmpR family regulator